MKNEHGQAPNYPDKPGPRGCIKCTYFAGWAEILLEGKQVDGEASVCGRERMARVNAAPNTGCAFWMREIGADDE